MMRDLEKYGNHYHQSSVKSVSKVLPESFKGFHGVSGKFKDISSLFTGRVKEVLFCNFVDAWHSSQLTEQREHLFLSLSKLLSKDGVSWIRDNTDNNNNTDDR